MGVYPWKVKATADGTSSTEIEGKIQITRTCKSTINNAFQTKLFDPFIPNYPESTF